MGWRLDPAGLGPARSTRTLTRRPVPSGPARPRVTGTGELAGTPVLVWGLPVQVPVPGQILLLFIDITKLPPTAGTGLVWTFRSRPGPCKAPGIPRKGGDQGDNNRERKRMVTGEKPEGTTESRNKRRWETLGACTVQADSL